MLLLSKLLTCNCPYLCEDWVLFYFKFQLPRAAFVFLCPAYVIQHDVLLLHVCNGEQRVWESCWSSMHSRSHCLALSTKRSPPSYNAPHSHCYRTQMKVPFICCLLYLLMLDSCLVLQKHDSQQLWDISHWVILIVFYIPFVKLVSCFFCRIRIYLYTYLCFSYFQNSFKIADSFLILQAWVLPLRTGSLAVGFFGCEVILAITSNSVEAFFLKNSVSFFCLWRHA